MAYTPVVGVQALAAFRPSALRPQIAHIVFHKKATKARTPAKRVGLCCGCDNCGTPRDFLYHETSSILELELVFPKFIKIDENCDKRPINLCKLPFRRTMNEPNEEPQEVQNPFAPTSELELNKNVSPSLSVPLAIGLAIIIALSFFLSIGLGISMLLLTIPAYIRAAGSSLQKIAAGQELTTSERLLTFITSIAAVLLCFFAGTIGLFVTCISLLTVSNASNNFWSSALMQNVGSIIFLILCSGAWLGTAGLVYWLTWPRRRNAAKKNAFKKNNEND